MEVLYVYPTRCLLLTKGLGSSGVPIIKTVKTGFGVMRRFPFFFLFLARCRGIKKKFLRDQLVRRVVGPGIDGSGNNNFWMTFDIDLVPWYITVPFPLQKFNNKAIFSLGLYWSHIYRSNNNKPIPPNLMVGHFWIKQINSSVLERNPSQIPNFHI